MARANTLAERKGWTPFSGLQLPYSLLQRDIERELLPFAEATHLTVAAWSPLGGGVLSGKFIQPGGAPTGTRIAPESISEHDRAVALAVQGVADELGVSPAQVAIAWTMARSEAVCPILGARRTEQLVDNLGALDLHLPPEAVQRLEAATEFKVGFPTDFIREMEGWVFAAAGLARP